MKHRMIKFWKNSGTNRSFFRGEVISVCVVTNEKLNGSGINNSRQRRNEQSEKAGHNKWIRFIFIVPICPASHLLIFIQTTET